MCNIRYKRVKKELLKAGFSELTIENRKYHAEVAERVHRKDNSITYEEAFIFAGVLTSSKFRAIEADTEYVYNLVMEQHSVNNM